MQRFKTLAVLGLLAFSCVHTCVLANMRAPRVIAQGSSSALYPHPTITALSETLALQCTLTACNVTATYWVTSDKQHDAHLTFVMPDAVPISAHVNQLSVNAQVQAFGPSRIEEQKMLAEIAKANYSSAQTSLHQAQFIAPLRAGTNQIEVRYEQKLYAIESDYGYFRKGRFDYTLRYEVWPLKEWVLAPNFALTFTAAFTPSETPGPWAEYFAPVQTMRCMAVQSKENISDLPGNPHHSSAVFNAQTLPQRLLCVIADQDLAKHRPWSFKDVEPNP